MSSKMQEMHVSPVLAKGALASCWVFGAWATYRLVVQFDRDLKPMVLAMMLAGALERPVAWAEMTYVNIMRLSRIVCWYPIYVVRNCCCWMSEVKTIRVICCKCYCCRRFLPDDAARTNRVASFLEEEWQAEEAHVIVGRMPNWVQKKLAPDLRKPWSDSAAGDRLIPRILALATILSLVSVLTMYIIDSLKWSMGAFYEPAAQLGRQRATDDLMSVTTPLIAMLQGNSSHQRDQFYRLQNISSRFTEFAQAEIQANHELVTSVISVGVTTAYQFVMFILYSFMWLLQPMTSQMQLYKIVNTYFKLKTYCSLVYATLTFGVLAYGQVPLAFFIAMTSFFLNFIPEVGAIVSLFLPVPILLLDGEHQPPHAHRNCDKLSGNETNSSLLHPKLFEHYQDCLLGARITYRLGRIVFVLLLLICVKLLIGNGLESYLMGADQVLAGQANELHGTKKQGSRHMPLLEKKKEGGRSQKTEAEELHPVIVLMVVVLGGAVWGPVGMLVSVPLISVTRLAMNQMKEDHMLEETELSL